MTDRIPWTTILWKHVDLEELSKQILVRDHGLERGFDDLMAWFKLDRAKEDWIEPFVCFGLGVRGYIAEYLHQELSFYFGIKYTFKEAVHGAH